MPQYFVIKDRSEERKEVEESIERLRSLCVSEDAKDALTVVEHEIEFLHSHVNYIQAMYKKLVFAVSRGKAAANSAAFAQVIE